jgi:hypothetical protein
MTPQEKIALQMRASVSYETISQLARIEGEQQIALSRQRRARTAAARSRIAESTAKRLRAIL